MNLSKGRSLSIPRGQRQESASPIWFTLFLILLKGALYAADIPEAVSFSDMGAYRSIQSYLRFLNLTKESKIGAATGTTADDVHTFFTYTNYTGPWILSKPTMITVKNYAGTIKSRKWMDYHQTKGHLLAEELCSTQTPSSGCDTRNATQNPMVTYQYYDEGNVQYITDPRNCNWYTTINYDSTKTYALEKINAKGHITTTEYHAGTGRLVKMVPPHLQGDPDPAHWFRYSYDVFGRKTREDRPDGGYTTWEYVAIGSPGLQRVATTEHILGGSTSLEPFREDYFDGLGRVYTVRSGGAGVSTTRVDTEFDEVGRVETKSNPYYEGTSSAYTSFIYDGLSRVTRRYNPDGTSSRTWYKGLVKETQDENYHRTKYTYDVFQRLVLVADPASTETQYTYDTLGNLIQVTAARNRTEQNTTTMTYNSLSQKTQMTDPDMGTWSYAYDKAGNLLTQTDARGQTTTFTYDEIGRVITKVSDITVTSVYDDVNVIYHSYPSSREDEGSSPPKKKPPVRIRCMVHHHHTLLTRRFP